MQLHRSLFLAALASACVRAQNFTGSIQEPPIATINTAVSASLVATASATPSSLGDPTQLSSYPLCAQRCSNQSAAAAPLIDYGCDIAEVGCQCQPPFRSSTAACEEVICDLQDYLKTQVLAQQLCGPFYEQNSTLGSAVSSAIASATSAALAATESKIPTNPAEWPPCAQACFDKYIPASGCGNLANRTCVCSSQSLNSNLGLCETATCDRTDIEKIIALANELCFPVGGQVSDSNASANAGIRPSSNTSTSLPSPSPFTGQASVKLAGGVALSSLIAMGLLGVVVVGL